MLINPLSLPVIQRPLSAQNFPLSPSTTSASSNLDYLDLAQSSHGLTRELIKAMHAPPDAEIDCTLKVLDDILQAAEMQSAELFSQASVEDFYLRKGLTDYIMEGEPVVDREVCQALNILAQNGLTPLHSEVGSAGCWPRLKHVLQLSNDERLARYLHNTKNIALRSVICVAIPTLLRQMVAYFIESGLETCSANKTTRMTLAVFAGPVPLLLNLGGGIRDYMQGTATAVTQFARAFNVVISSAALIAAGTTGVLAGLASTLLSFHAYSVLRECGQSLFRLSDNTQVHVGSTLGTAALYIPNQIGISSAMSYLASPSGAGAALQNCSFTDTVINDLFRAGLNTPGEILDAMVFSGLNSLQTGTELRNHLEVGLPDRQQISDTLFNALAARTALMNTPILTASSLETAFAHYFDERTLVQLNDILTSGVLGTLYPLFVATVAGHRATRKSPNDSDC